MNYKHDIAISLCKEDAQYARELKSQLNPGLKIFFYEDNQEDIISRSGTEVFASVFKEARVVIILSRKEWGQTFYTELEMHSITDRYKKEGLSFLVVIPMVPGEKPIWYPETMIYADPLNLSIEKIAVVVEYRVTQSGGLIKPVTLEERYRHLQERIASKKQLIQKQLSFEALKAVRDEITTIHTIVQSKIDVLKDNNLWETQLQTWPQPLPGAYFSINGIILEVIVTAPNEAYQKVVSCQDYLLMVGAYQSVGEFTNLWEEVKFKKPFKVAEYRYLYNGLQNGWSIPFRFDKGISQNESHVLFRHREPDDIQHYMRYYDLKDPMSGADIIDEWFQLLLTLSSETIEKYI